MTQLERDCRVPWRTLTTLAPPPRRCEVLPYGSIFSNPLCQEVVTRLRERIFSREFPPGSWIDEKTLVREYGISRTPIREALKQLAGEGLLIHEPRRGCRVVEVSPRQGEEVCAALALLEGQGAYEAATNIEPKDLPRLSTLHEQLELCAAQQDRIRWLEADHNFHCTLYEIGGNRCLLRIIRDLRKLFRLAACEWGRLDSSLELSLNEHRDIMAAIRRQDAAAVRECVRAHLLNCGKVMAASQSALESGVIAAQNVYVRPEDGTM